MCGWNIAHHILCACARRKRRCMFLCCSQGSTTSKSRTTILSSPVGWQRGVNHFSREDKSDERRLLLFMASFRYTDPSKTDSLFFFDDYRIARWAEKITFSCFRQTDFMREKQKYGFQTEKKFDKNFRHGIFSHFIIFLRIHPPLVLNMVT